MPKYKTTKYVAEEITSKHQQEQDAQVEDWLEDLEEELEEEGYYLEPRLWNSLRKETW